MTKITVEIDCGPDLCGPCHGLGWVALAKDGPMTDPVCNIFNHDLAADGEENKNARRCGACRVAEI